MAASNTLIEDLVKKPVWKEMLYDLIETRKLDPWNIDIVELADGFLKKIKEIQDLELAVPANVILAASILLRYKSEVLVWVEPVAETASEDTGYAPEEWAPLTLASRLLPKRQITLDELVQEMEKSIRYDKERAIKPRGGIETIIELPVAGMDMEKRMEETYDRLKEMQDPEGWVVFSQLVTNAREIVPVLVSLLHLAQKEKVDLHQEVFFQEILIRVLDRKKEIVVAL